MEQNLKKEVIVEVDSLTVSFGNAAVLKNISFSITRGSFVGLIGPNGAGKSTLLKTLLGLVRPTSGSYTRAPELTIRYVPQHYVLSSFVPVSVSEVVQMGSNTRVRLLAIEAILKEVGLNESFSKRNYHTLSGGQKQRVMIARALVVKPDIIFFDEPLSGVDLKTKSHIYTFLKDLNKRGVTIFFVSHDIDHVIDACDHILCLDQSLHRGCHPTEFAQGVRSTDQTDQSTTCLVTEGRATKKEKIHHHHT